MKHTMIAAFSIGFLLMAAASGAQANLIVNGSFEDTTNFVDNTGQDNDSLAGGSTAMTGWTITPGHNVSWIGPTNPFSLTASSGAYFLDLTDYQTGAPYGGLSQVIATTPGAHYTLTFDLGSSSIYGLPDGVTATAGSGSGVFTSTATGTNNWESETLNFVATGASTTVSFLGASGANYIGLDNVSVTLSAIPEAATWALMLTGFAGVGVAMRRRTNPIAT